MNYVIKINCRVYLYAYELRPDNVLVQSAGGEVDIMEEF